MEIGIASPSPASFLLSSPCEEGQLALGHEAEGGNDEDGKPGDPKSPPGIHVRQTMQAANFKEELFLTAIQRVLVLILAAQNNPKTFVLVLNLTDFLINERNVILNTGSLGARLLVLTHATHE